MEKIFIACPISKYINNDEFINDEFKMFIKNMLTKFFLLYEEKSMEKN